MSSYVIDLDKTAVANMVSQLTVAEKTELLPLLSQPQVVSNAAQKIDYSTKNEDYLKLVREAQNYGQEEFDKNILYVSSSALGLTLAFIEKIVKIENAVFKLDLLKGWIILGVTIALYVLSHLISAMCLNIMIGKIKKTKSDIDANTDPAVVSIRSKAGKIIMGINIFLYLSMCTGIFFIALFLYQNLTR